MVMEYDTKLAKDFKDCFHLWWFKQFKPSIRSGIQLVQAMNDHSRIISLRAALNNAGDRPTDYDLRVLRLLTHTEYHCKPDGVTCFGIYDGIQFARIRVSVAESVSGCQGLDHELVKSVSPPNYVAMSSGFDSHIGRGVDMANLLVPIAIFPNLLKSITDEFAMIRLMDGETPDWKVSAMAIAKNEKNYTDRLEITVPEDLISMADAILSSF